MSDMSAITDPIVKTFVQDVADPTIDEYKSLLGKLQERFHQNAGRYYQVIEVCDIPKMGSIVACDWSKSPTDESFAPANNPDPDGQSWPPVTPVQPRIDVVTQGAKRSWNAQFTFSHGDSIYRRAILVTDGVEQYDRWEVIDANAT